MSASVRNKTLLEPDQASGYSGIEEHSAPLHAFLEHATTYIFPLLFGLNVYWASTRLYELEQHWLFVLAVPIGVLGGDLVSGVVHWAADTYCAEDTPVVGPSLVKPFRMHHIYPRDICTHNFVATVGNVCILAFPVLLLCLYLAWLMPESGWLAFIVLSVALMSVFTVATNQFHKWAHQESPSSFARLLQRTRLVLEPSHHKLHHTEPFEMHYCITNGWLNPLLNKVKFFRRLEAALGLVGIKTAKAKEQLQQESKPGRDPV
jgi:hypothetical protein